MKLKENFGSTSIIRDLIGEQRLKNGNVYYNTSANREIGILEHLFYILLTQS